jgi:hypothetical protein
MVPAVWSGALREHRRVLYDLTAFDAAISHRFSFRTIAVFCAPRYSRVSKFVRHDFAFIDESTGPEILAVTLEEPKGGYWRYLQQSSEDRDPDSVHMFLTELNDRVRSKKDISLPYLAPPPSSEYLLELLRRLGLPRVDGPFVLLFAISMPKQDIWNAKAYAFIHMIDEMFSDLANSRGSIERLFDTIKAMHEKFPHGRPADLEGRTTFLAEKTREPISQRFFRMQQARPITFAQFMAVYNTDSDRDIKVVMTLHGVNTFGKWQKDITPWLGLLGWIHMPLDYAKYPSSIIDVAMFLMGRTREHLMQQFRDSYGEITTDAEMSPYKDHVVVIAHSFGTKVVADSLVRYSNLMNFERFIFCGSIVDADFDWNDHLTAGRIQGVLNEYGSNDVWTRAYRSIRRTNIAGVEGFTHPPQGIVNRQRKVTHSDWFNRLQFSKVWVPYLQTGDSPP